MSSSAACPNGLRCVQRSWLRGEADYNHLLMANDAATPLSRPAGRRRASSSRRIFVPLALCALLGIVVVVAGLLFEQRYAERIYPGILIGDVPVGNLTLDEAAFRVRRRYEAQNLAVFQFESQKWFATWREIGIRVRADDAVRQAFRIGRLGRPDERLRDWQNRRSVTVAFTFDEQAARGFLQSYKAQVYIAPSDARVEIDASRGIARSVPATPGRELDIETTLGSMFAHVLTQQPALVITRPISPTIVEVSSAVDQLNDWLQRPFTIYIWWQGQWVARPVTPQERVNWVRAQIDAGRWTAHWHALGVREFVTALPAELGEHAELRADEAAAMLRVAFERREPALWVVALHREHRYIIQRGDTFESLQDRYGIPVARLLAANPDIWQAGFAPGRAITIPAQSIMMPFPITPTNLKRIEVDLTTQTLRAYDGATLALSATISSGIPKWRTLGGVFQVLERVDEAYNKLARVKMPNWLSIYDLGEPGESLTNGIHALPVLSGGRRLWAGHLGTPVSFGCVVLGIEDSDFLYRWAEIGTPVMIYGKTPPSPFTYDDLIEAQRKTSGP
ncbi:MAG: L,D-transpeptidase family protein [Anaerolineae bacterium]|nr:L,D-transpeptidase family protein [Thermoflexales bacterium]MDW8408240.1 L,D-transpeptidase family protein [Anaerolineae bacterium]